MDDRERGRGSVVGAADDAAAPLEDWLVRRSGIRRHEPLARHSQYGIGGPADWYLRLESVARLPEVMRRCHQAGLPVTVIGAGSNSLILDGGIRGLVLELPRGRLREIGDDVIELPGGAMMPRAALDCAQRGIGGLEFGIGVPGTCGASVRGNAGAFGTEIRDVLIDCDLVAPDGAAVHLINPELGFGYRSSRLKRDLTGHVVTAARLRVGRELPETVRALTDSIQAERRATQPYNARSLGSMFTNPPGDHAGRLIDMAGLKGARVGGAEVSLLHANFIVNAGGASAADVLALMDLVQRTVAERFGVHLVPEIAVLGEPLRDGQR
ncbi:MAG TPA: UDP-N-acetylmuramate dehydrogenase [Candidatus Binatia bacterium]|nr:UDP-N-acetylmuramate dehydrogenase [Candidatus Binatia bacterium]